MDWHHPDGALCATDEGARQRFVAYTHGLIRELMSNYGKIDVLWYDVDWPLSAEQWESEKMNQMVFELQPDIIVKAYDPSGTLVYCRRFTASEQRGYTSKAPLSVKPGDIRCS